MSARTARQIVGTQTSAGVVERPDVREAARQYIRRGWSVTPVASRAKNPNRARWQNERHTEADVDRVFAAGGNVGLLTGAASGGLLDVDLDTPEAIAAAPYFLPATDRRHGRPSKPSSHWWYVATDAGDFKIDKYVDPARQTADDKTCCLVELRGAGHQTVVPPSIHESGEPIAWEADGEPGLVTLAELRAAVAQIAACALLAGRWPDGARHEAALALAGLLLHGGMPQPDAERFVEALARVACDPEWHEQEAREYVRAVRDTAADLAAGRPVTGGPRLAELVTDGDAVVGTLRKWLNLHLGDTDADTPRVLTVDDFLRVEFAPRENIFDPVFPRQGLGLLHAWRGIGKTYLSLAMALAAAIATPLLRWHVTRPWRVLFVDGEMPGPLLQERIARLVRALPGMPDATFLRIVTPDLQPSGIPDLGTERGQRWLDGAVGDADLIVLDNLSSLIRTGSENADELWLPVASWLLRHRAAGRAVQMVHHDGKGQKQRGISRREDLLDTVIQLRKPPDYQETDGARFILSYEKHRGFHGPDAKPFEARLVETEEGGLSWAVTAVDDARTVQIADMLNDGRSVSQIAKALDIGRATVQRHKQKAVDRGLYNE